MKAANNLTSQTIRAVWSPRDKDWYFSVNDVIGVITGSSNSKDYFKKMKVRNRKFSKEAAKIIVNMKLMVDDKPKVINCAKASGFLTIIPAIPSPLAKPYEFMLKVSKLTKGVGAIKSAHRKNLRASLSDTELFFTLLWAAAVADKKNSSKKNK